MSLTKATMFLHREYEEKAFWWELIEMFRRFFLVGLMVVIAEGTLLQLVIGTLAAAQGRAEGAVQWQLDDRALSVSLTSGEPYSMKRIVTGSARGARRMSRATDASMSRSISWW